MKRGDGRHLVDDQMIAIYIGAEPRFGRRTMTSSHLSSCAECAQRYEAFVQQMAELREDAVAEADAAFTPAMLEQQRQAILHRLGHALQPARVLPFPSHNTRNLSIFTGSQVRRWIAAAAAAGLMIGVTLGRMSDFLAGPGAGSLQRATSEITLHRPIEPRQPIVVETPPSEDEILSRAEQVQGGLLVPAELEPLGSLTPIRQVSMSLPSGR